MISFFISKDFEGPAALNRWIQFDSYEYKEILKFVCERANAKLEREAILIGYKNNTWTEFMTHNRKLIKHPYTATAFRIAVEQIKPIEKCKHPFSDTKAIAFYKDEKLDTVVFHCNCGAKVKPNSFIEVD